MTTALSLQALLVGQARPLGPKGVPSAIAKAPVTKPIYLGPNGLVGDEQGDTRHHGGPDKALHHYALDHYPAWTVEIGASDVLARPGAFGENLATLGMTESEVAVGDVFTLGEAVVEVSQGRQPCWKLNDRFGVFDMARRVQLSGRTGWYYRVLQPGIVRPNDRLVRVHRHAPQWTIRKVWHAFYSATLDSVVLEQLSALPQLAETWRGHAMRRLDTGVVEDWTRRLTGEDGDHA